MAAGNTASAPRDSPAFLTCQVPSASRPPVMGTVSELPAACGRQSMECRLSASGFQQDSPLSSASTLASPAQPSPPSTIDSRWECAFSGSCAALQHATDREGTRPVQGGMEPRMRCCQAVCTAPCKPVRRAGPLTTPPSRPASLAAPPGTADRCGGTARLAGPASAGTAQQRRGGGAVAVAQGRGRTRAAADSS